MRIVPGAKKDPSPTPHPYHPYTKAQHTCLLTRRLYTLISTYRCSIRRNLMSLLLRKFLERLGLEDETLGSLALHSWSQHFCEPRLESHRLVWRSDGRIDPTETSFAWYHYWCLFLVHLFISIMSIHIFTSKLQKWRVRLSGCLGKYLVKHLIGQHSIPAVVVADRNLLWTTDYQKPTHCASYWLVADLRCRLGVRLYCMLSKRF